MFRQFGWPEILIVLLVALLVLGPSKLPQLARSVGKAIRELRQQMSGAADKDDEPPPPPLDEEEEG